MLIYLLPCKYKGYPELSTTSFRTCLRRFVRKEGLTECSHFGLVVLTCQLRMKCRSIVQWQWFPFSLDNAQFMLLHESLEDETKILLHIIYSYIRRSGIKAMDDRGLKINYYHSSGLLLCGNHEITLQRGGVTMSPNCVINESHCHPRPCSRRTI